MPFGLGQPSAAGSGLEVISYKRRSSKLSAWGLGFGFWVLGFGFWVLDLGFGFWILGFGFWVFEFWILGFGFWDVGFWNLGFGIWVLGFLVFGILGFGFWILDLGFRFWVLGFGFWFLKGVCLKFTGYNIKRSRQWVISEDESCRGFTLCNDVPKRLSDRSWAASRPDRARGLDFRVQGSGFRV